MDVEMENLQFLGIYGILQETFKLIHKWRKIFTQITIAFILPLSLLHLANMEISNSFVEKITQNKLISQHTQKSTPEILELSNVVSLETISYILLNFAFLIFFTIFSLLATSAVIYTVDRIYMTRDDVSFKHVIKIIPKVWKRLLVTSLCFVAAFLVFNFVALFLLFLIVSIAVLIYGQNALTFNNNNGMAGMILLFFIIFYCLAALYLTIIWQLSSVVSVLEDSCGFKAMARSKALLKGKIWMATKLWMLLSLPFGVVHLLSFFLAFRLASAGAVGRGILGIISVLQFLVFYLVEPLMETVVYFVCKSYHSEIIDKLALSDPLRDYLLADYDPLKDEKMQGV